MSNAAERWDRRYRRARPTFAVDALLIEHAGLFAVPGRVLDVACGTGGNALWFAEHGFDTFAVDASEIALKQLSDEAARRTVTLRLFAADLDVYCPPPDSFHVVTVFRFLDRGLFPSLGASVLPGGILMYKTFNLVHHRETGFNRAYVLEPGELRAAFPGFDTIATNDGETLRDPQSYWIGRRPSGSALPPE